jgi:serine/threonine protein kinase
MTETLKVILGNNAALAVFLVAASLLVLTVIAIYVFAFIQGRDLSFWPPKIGPKPSLQNSPKEVPNPVRSSKSDSTEPGNQQTIPSIRVGTTLTTSGGGRLVIQSSSYTGVRAALMRAKDVSERQVMVKLYWRGLQPESSAWTAFSREYNAHDGLHHRNIVQTLDQGLWSGYPFLVLEYFPGGTLFDLIQNRDRLPGVEILSIAEQIASGIDYAHTQGRVHRDITPSNILLESDARGRVAISDFGIARILGVFDTHATADEPAFEGTSAYVAPEVFRADKMTPLVDIYGFGVVLFQMIAGRCPFPDVESIYQLFNLKIKEPVPRLSSFQPVPDDLDQRLLETMDPNPERRPRTARAVLSGIEDALLKLS